MIRLKNNFIEAMIQPLGAELVMLKNQLGLNLLWEKDEKFWNRIAPNLFPIVGKLKDDRFNYNGQTFFMKQHGFARDLMFETVEQSDSRVKLLLSNSESTTKQYPFLFEFIVEYELFDSQLNYTFKTRNSGQKHLFYSVGGHPGFALNRRLENYQLNFHKSFEVDRWLIDNGHYTGEVSKMKIDQILQLKNDYFKKDAIVFKNPPFDSVTLELDSIPIVTIQSDNWEAIGFWTKQDTPFFCIEPWWGWADSKETSGNMEEKQGIHVLEPGETEKLSFQIIIHG